MLHWHQVPYQELINRWKSGTLPHALLFSGESGLGKQSFARMFAKLLLCTRPSDEVRACDQCHSCHLFQAGTHPDFYEVGLEEQNDQQAKFIKIDQIRELCQRLILKSQNQGMKVAVINPADRMNHNAANSLLKTLEEPSDDTLLILITCFPSRLPPTIRSRCQKVLLSAPEEQEKLEILKRRFPTLNASKLLAVAIDVDVIDEHAALQQIDMRDTFFRYVTTLTQDTQALTVAAAYAADNVTDKILRWFSGWIEDMVKLKVTGDLPHINSIDFNDHLQDWTNRVDLNRLFGFYTELNQVRQLISGSVNLQLLMESTLLSWAELYSLS